MGTSKTNIIDDLEEIVRLGGDKVAVHTPECVTWKTAHENCKGCNSQLGCEKSVRLGLTILASNKFNYELIAKTTDEILAAKSPEELKKIHIPIPSPEYWG